MDWHIIASIVALCFACFAFGFSLADGMHRSRRHEEMRQRRRRDQWLARKGR